MNTKQMIINHINNLNDKIDNSRDSANAALLMQAKSIALLALTNVEK
jgi:hypothetical protein